MYWFCINLSRSSFVWILNFGHFTRDCVGKFAAKMHNLQNSKEPWSIEIYAEPLYTFERGGSEVSFDTKTFKCVYVNFCSIGIINQPILCENYTSTKVERIYANCNVILVTCCNVFVLLQDRWLWCHSSKWYMKHKSLILMSSKVYCIHQQGIDI